MSLGVLNNLSAVYAENNLNNTTNSLNTVLQQLSSGSKINSGADDAAGLSLVDGLQANSMALAQSGTNAQEGVGLLQVADGALSQVTSLLNRAVTLATEASNGTLNSSQDTAANQEYQSILSEISNIGTTTTYNQESVFNTNTNIYTGDSTASGASINDLNIRSLSSSNLGDTSGTMSYGNGASGSTVFVDLGADAAAGDDLNGATSQLAVSYLSGNNTVSTTISVGSGTGYANTAQGLISAINNAGLGLNASFTTGAVAGTSTGTGDSGIMITGSVGGGTAPSSESYSGTVGITGSTTAGGNTISGSITLQEGNGSAAQVTTADVAAANGGEAAGSVSLTQLAAYITADSALGVNATVNGSGKLALDSVNSSGTATTTALNVTSNLQDTAVTTSTGDSTAMSYTAVSAYSVGVANNVTAASIGATGTGGVIDTGANNALLGNGFTAQAADASVVAGTATSSGTATISYTDKAGESLSGTDLSNQTDAETALTSLNAAITDVAAQDGYVGAQINTLNAVSSVLSTQAENVTSAQNAVQATDYASATSNMSKYEILSQTGISALAQANSMQQEVTKLLQ
jgi:flagellin